MRKAAIPGRVKIGEKMMTAPNLINMDKLISSKADRLREMGPSTEDRVSIVEVTFRTDCVGATNLLAYLECTGR